MLIKISDIEVGERQRSLDMEVVVKLADSIKVLGLLNPITVSATQDSKNPFKLESGNHRLEALKLLGRDEIEAQISNRDPLLQSMAEIDENLVRAELNPWERANHTARRKKIWESLYPDTGRGGDHASQEFRQAKEEGRLPSFARDTANKTGITERTVYQDLQIAQNIPPKVQKKAQEINLPRGQAIELSRLKPNLQEEVVELMARKEARSVPEGVQKVKLQRAIELGERIEAPSNVKLIVGDWIEETRNIPSGSIDAVITAPPGDVDLQHLIDECDRILVDGGKLAIISDPRVAASHAKLDYANLRFIWAFADLLVHPTDSPDHIKSSWAPVLLFGKGEISLGKGSFPDVIGRAWDKLTKVEDSSLQLVVKLTDEKDKIYDPFCDSRNLLVSYIAGRVGREFIGVTSAHEFEAVIKTHLDEVAHAIAEV